MPRRLATVAGAPLQSGRLIRPPESLPAGGGACPRTPGHMGHPVPRALPVCSLPGPTSPPPDSAECTLQGGRCANPLPASPASQRGADKHQETKNSQSLWHFIVYKTKAPVARTQSFCLQQQTQRRQSLALKYLGPPPHYVNMPPLGPQATAEAPALALGKPAPR